MNKKQSKSAHLGHPKNEHSPRARRRKMRRLLDKYFPLKKNDDEV